MHFDINDSAWKVSKYEVFSGPNTGKYRPEKIPYLDTFHAVWFKSFRALKWRSKNMKKGFFNPKKLTYASTF